MPRIAAGSNNAAAEIIIDKKKGKHPNSVNLEIMKSEASQFSNTYHRPQALNRNRSNRNRRNVLRREVATSSASPSLFL